MFPYVSICFHITVPDPVCSGMFRHKDLRSSRSEAGPCWPTVTVTCSAPGFLGPNCCQPRFPTVGVFLRCRGAWVCGKCWRVATCCHCKPWKMNVVNLKTFECSIYSCRIWIGHRTNINLSWVARPANIWYMNIYIYIYMPWYHDMPKGENDSLLHWWCFCRCLTWCRVTPKLSQERSAEKRFW